MGEHSILSVKREDARVEGRGPPCAGRGLGEWKCQRRIRPGVNTHILELGGTEVAFSLFINRAALEHALAPGCHPLVKVTGQMYQHTLTYGLVGLTQQTSLR